MKVFKYEIHPQANITLMLPKGAKLLSVQAQYDTPCLWALVDPEAELEERRFRFAGTGHEIQFDGDFEFVDTFQMAGGQLVFHIFEELP